ncbi:hypothetical protein CLV40_108133 [Actinokineospora auranticolor]|uniref:Uncharacterized protein n=1 Tax=Actinokineospora auranticolor TaxID=155976 RepID=A0A2S6GPL4_9PSEU|nr:hypothetical protein CLV40_108133 [Actinokineospora auranticolor]
MAGLRVTRAAAAAQHPAAPPTSPGETVNQFTGSAGQLMQAGSVGTVVFNSTPEPAEHLAAPSWVRYLWEVGAPHAARFELRHLTHPQSNHISTYLLTRASTADTAAALTATLRQALPAPLLGHPVDNDDELRWTLSPFHPNTADVVEIGKTITASRTTRGDSPNPWLAAVTPWRAAPAETWTRLWSTLASSPTPILLSVGLLPFRVGEGLRANLAARAIELDYLARTGPSPTGGVFGKPRPPDQFAVAATEVLTDAVHRYTDRVFQTRVTLAGATPLPAWLTHQAAEAVSPGANTPGLHSRPATVVHPSPTDRPTAWHNATTLDFRQLTPTETLPPEAIGPVERRLLAITDLDEAAAALRAPRDLG